MRTAMGKVMPLGLLATLALAPAWAIAQGYGQGQGQGQPPQQPAKPSQPGFTLDNPAPPPMNPEEEAAAKAFFESKSTDPQHQIQLGEEFLRKYPATRYAAAVYGRLTTLYLATGQEDKMVVAGEKALELNPDSVDVMAQLGMVMSRRAGSSGLDTDQKLAKAERYSKRAIALLEALQKPANSTLSDEEFNKAKNEELSMAHSGLGFVNYQRQKYADAAAEFEQATKLALGPDPVDFFVLGLSYEHTKRFGDAATAFERCVAIPGAMQDRCKKAQDEAKRLALTQPASPKQ